MSNIIKYKDYVGSVEFSEEDGLFYGKVLGIRSLLSYEGENAKELISDFHSAIDGYLEYCEKEGVEPEKAFKGSFNIRIPQSLHREAYLYATERDESLNSFVEEAITYYVTKLKKANS